MGLQFRLGRANTDKRDGMLDEISELLSENRETKFVGAILCFVGLVIWFLVGIN